ncbi:family 20 glycosylhydrolase [Kitasatospora sp. NBC_00240]|uniref:family 20 glycosylhydrolase n=1 Tax=Kitasatospora sp. NBC_00240 TaxID=2903567 RepID=UPI00224C831D|nr:family 20 glycosylhydrolase [Kitasatospora sp. NBC_00240]MCX5208499.1 family 20 glycosylhydrolase [Kitasatospora sp. NBC_00240]
MRLFPRRGPALAVLGAVAVVVPLLSGTTAVTAAHAVPAVPAIVPQPVSESAGTGSGFTLAAGTQVDVLSTAPAAVGVGSYLAGLLAPATGFTLPVVSSTQPQSGALVLDPNGSATLGAEGYTLTSNSGGVTVTAHGAEGLFRGVQTLRQLLPAAVESPTVKPGPWTVAPVQISDSPRYSYRGVMLDVARRFYPVAQVKRYIDEAATYKINTLHLHLTDDQGWRIAIGALPNLITVGASTQSGFTGGTSWYYTAAEYQDLVAYASSRFMTVVPEIDGPGHTSAALASVANLNCNNQAIAPYSGFSVGISLYCLSDSQHVSNVSSFLNTVISTVAALTPGPYIHVGGDETPQATASQYASYVSAAASATTAQGKKVIGWHQLGQGTLPANSLLQFWGDAGDRSTVGTSQESVTIQQVRSGVAQGAGFIMSPSDHAYLDMKYDSSTPYGLSWEGYVSAQKAYDWDPTTVTAKTNGNSPVVPAAQITGVEAALWADRAYSGSNNLPTSTSQFPEPSVYADHMSFPRLPAIAEIGWSPQSTHDWTSFSQRLAAQGPRWTAAGINYYAAPDISWPTGGSGTLNGVHTVTTGSQALDDPGSSTSTGLQMDTWALHGGSNQKWTFTQQSDGSYTLVNGASGLCLDVNGGSMTAGAAAIQYTCGGALNQRWQVTPLTGGGYTLTSAKSGLLLTTASTTNGALVTQQTNTNSALQHWTIT